MKTSFLIRLGSSALLLGVTGVGCTTGNHPAALSSAPVGDMQAMRSASDAVAALKARDAAKAIASAERAVALDPRNAGHRATLGQAYMLAGRFLSAETSFNEALALEPDQARARFNLALTQIALGKRDPARASLARLGGAVPDADLGLATTLAGDSESGIVILERAARAADATMKTRQNLALAYAMAGRWNEAHAVAQQDVPADQLALRLSQWAQFARPDSSSAQVASLLGVTLVADAGRPAALALADPAPTAAPEAFAAAEPAPTSGETAAEPIETAAAEMPAPAYVTPAAATAQAEPLVLADASPRHTAVRSRSLLETVGSGKWVIQLGAFSQARSVDAAWTRIASRVAGSQGYAPARSTFVRDGSTTLYRLTLAGFGSRDSAARMCGQIRVKGGNCFVRPAAGEQPIQMASNLNSKIAMR